jgi:hypothetical protein
MRRAPDITYGSSLGPPQIHAILASDLGDVQEASDRFWQAVLVDLEDTRGNASEAFTVAHRRRHLAENRRRVGGVQITRNWTGAVLIYSSWTPKSLSCVGMINGVINFLKSLHLELSLWVGLGTTVVWDGFGWFLTDWQSFTIERGSDSPMRKSYRSIVKQQKRCEACRRGVVASKV